ncbi:hypothetical protein M378DRAFT_225033 [Amanita muscaria Koide BX008]|uniref:Uncharacterized protein n=1 Tax=Amanita muscaria (strain Koide BX008) TaxID=946122 RepID=A0A0C2TVX3_AMAMK|nr:hypothetical protein M378DRAFT_225033 [Amanita muscaria Koide BX008]
MNISAIVSSSRGWQRTETILTTFERRDQLRITAVVSPRLALSGESYWISVESEEAGLFRETPLPFHPW